MNKEISLSEEEQQLYVTGVYAQQLLDSTFYNQVMVELNTQLAQKILQTPPEATHKREYYYMLNRALLEFNTVLLTSASILSSLENKLEIVDEEQLDLFYAKD